MCRLHVCVLASRDHDRSCAMEVQEGFRGAVAGIVVDLREGKGSFVTNMAWKEVNGERLSSH